MKTLNASLILEKNKLASASPWIILFEIEIDDSTTLRLAAYLEDVTFDSNTYTAFPAIVDALKEDSQGKLNTLNISVANINRTISAYVENNNMLGRDVTIKIVNSAYLTDNTAYISFTYRVNKIHISDEVAVFELGHENLFLMNLPRQRYVRTKCRHAYKDSRCGYTGAMLTCDYTLDGANGCREHDNTLNFGGAPALPYGRLYGI